MKLIRKKQRLCLRRSLHLAGRMHNIDRILKRRKASKNIIRTRALIIILEMTSQYVTSRIK